MATPNETSERVDRAALAHAIADRPKTGRAAPGPPGHRIFGSTPDFIRDPVQTILDGWRTYGDVVRFPLGGPYSTYLLAHPDAVKHVLQDDHQNFTKHPFYNGKLKAVVGDGILTSEGSLWLRQRRLIQPAFHRQRLAALGQLMVEATTTLLDSWETRASSHQPFDVAAEMMRLTLDIISQAMFGATVDGDTTAIGAAVKASLEHVNGRMRSYVDLPTWLPLPEHRRFRRARRTLDEVVYRLIDKRRTSGGDRGDLLSLLLAARDEETSEGMTDEQIRDEVMTIFIAGHETTAVALTWIWYLLSRHPDVARKLRSELATRLGGRLPTVADLPNLPYNRMVVDEALRLYPAAWVMARTPARDDVIDGYRIPAGQGIFLSPFVTHRHPAFWTNPEGFDPERFRPELVASRPRYAYFPFGGGPHQCIGNHFALLEAQLILATIAQRYRLELDPGHPVAFRPLVTLRARYGMKMRVYPVDSRDD